MNHYIPLFSKIVDSSLWDESDTVIKVFLSMLAKKEKDDVVIASAYAISNWARKTEAETIEALKVLSSPDTRRLEPQPFDGRRIERIEGGWRILNGSFYQKEMQKLNRREYLRLKQQEHRDKLKANATAQPPDPPPPVSPKAQRIDPDHPTEQQRQTGFDTMRTAMQQAVKQNPAPVPAPKKPDPAPPAPKPEPVKPAPRPPVRRQLTEQEREAQAQKAREQARILREGAKAGLGVDELAELAARGVEHFGGDQPDSDVNPPLQGNLGTTRIEE